MSAGDYIGTAREIRRIGWPGTERQVGLLLLSCADVQDAAFAAAEHFDRKRQQTTGVLADLFQWEWEYQLVFRMLLDPDSKRPEDRVFQTAAEVRGKLTPDLVQHFLDQHAALRLECAKRLELTVVQDQADG